MTCERFVDQIGELVDGTLGAGQRPALEAHLERCATCQALVDDLRRIRAAAAGLDRLSPPDHVWLTLAGRLRQQIAAERDTAELAPAAAASRQYWSWLAAAAAIVVIATAAVFSLWRTGPSRPTVVSDPSHVATLPARGASDAGGADLVESIETELRLAEAHYEKAIVGLERIASAEEQTLDPQVAAVLRKNLSVIDEAISQSRAALRSQPESMLAQESLFEAFRRKIALLQDTIALINEMRKGNQAGAARIVGGLNPS